MFLAGKPRGKSRVYQRPISSIRLTGSVSMMIFLGAMVDVGQELYPKDRVGFCTGVGEEIGNWGEEKEQQVYVTHRKSGMSWQGRAELVN